MNKSFFLLFACSAAMAAPLTWERLVKSVDEDPVLQASQKRLEIASSQGGTKLWDNLEFRYELDGFSFAKHDFELRMKPKSFGEGSAEKEQYAAQKSYNEARLTVDRSNLMYERYERALRYYIRRKIKHINEQLYQVNLDRIEVLHIKAGSENFNSEDLISAIESETSIRATLMSDSAALRDAEMKMHLWVVDFDSVALDSSWLPTMEELAASLSDGYSVDEKFPEIMKAKAKMDSERAKSKSDLAKGRDYISHIGFGYSLRVESLMERYKTLDGSDVATEYSPYYGYKKEFLDKTGCTSASTCSRTADILVPDADDRQLKDKFFVNLAVKLPFFDSNNGNLLKNQVAELDAESDYLDAVRGVSQKVARLSEEIVSLIAQWKVRKEFVEKVTAGKMFDEISKTVGSDPLLLLRARESALESDMKALRLEADIYDRYLILLGYAGVLGNANMHNHLREGLK